MTLVLTLSLVTGALVAIGLAAMRLVLGPTQADRIVALDVVFSASIVMTAAAALASGRALYLDLGLGLAVVGFVATVVWARLIESSPKGTR
ncbi:MAG: hypothetical protein JW751_24340 [Polyangiaceae bacterium]|nr:hypothetical protein [Polyangiaceae bacterium]